MNTANPSVPSTVAPSAPAGSRRRAWLLTFGLVLVFVPLMSWIDDCYPFSDFPMYAKLVDAWSLELTDQNGVGVNQKKIFNEKCPAIRKLVSTRASKVRHEYQQASIDQMDLKYWAIAAERTLEWILAHHTPRRATQRDITTLQIWRVSYRRRDGKAQVVRELLASRPAPWATFPAAQP
jgi:hypothetical protein